jgi:hypothetical protein
MIKKSYGNKAEDERAGRAPEPYVLVQNEEGGYSNDEKPFIHSRLNARKEYVFSLRPEGPQANSPVRKDGNVEPMMLSSAEGAAHFNSTNTFHRTQSDFFPKAASTPPENCDAGDAFLDFLCTLSTSPLPIC